MGAQGWTTWDPASMAVWEHLPSGVRCQLVLQDSEGRNLQPIGWIPLEDYLPDAGGHSLAHLVINTDSAQVEIECGAEGDIAACRIRHIEGDNVTAHWEVENALGDWQVHALADDVALAPPGASVVGSELKVFSGTASAICQSWFCAS